MATKSERQWYKGIAIGLAFVAAWIAWMAIAHHFDSAQSDQRVPGFGLATPGMRTEGVIKAIKADDAPQPR